LQLAPGRLKLEMSCCVLLWPMRIVLLRCSGNLWSSVLREKLIVIQLVKKFPAFYGTRGFIQSSQVLIITLATTNSNHN